MTEYVIFIERDEFVEARAIYLPKKDDPILERPDAPEVRPRREGRDVPSVVQVVGAFTFS